jgi:benzoate/toluate 1,2-dioxygenase subunit beta
VSGTASDGRPPLEEARAFLLQEAELLDGGRYQEWEALWEDEAEYWIPTDPEGGDPDWSLSIIHDDRTGIRNRIKRLTSGAAYTQEPRSQLRRAVSNVQVAGAGGAELEVSSNFILLEYRRSRWTTWAGRSEHTLRAAAGGVRIRRKVVRLVGCDSALPMLQFLP